MLQHFTVYYNTPYQIAYYTIVSYSKMKECRVLSGWSVPSLGLDACCQVCPILQHEVY